MGAAVGLCPPGAEAFILQKTAFSGGAVRSSGGSYSIQATVAEAGVVGSSAGGSFQLVEGFWIPFPGILPVEIPDRPTPRVHALQAAYPNPFRGRTSIPYAVAEATEVDMVLYDVAGRRVRTLIEESHAPGWFLATWDGRDDGGRTLGSGVYYLSVRIGDLAENRKLLLTP
jgi:hypothetical protein